MCHFRNFIVYMDKKKRKELPEKLQNQDLKMFLLVIN